jgi:hypothetical protein
MHTTTQILDEIGRRAGNSTTYHLAKLFKTTDQTVGHWRKGRSIMGPKFAVKAAELLDWEPAYVLACIEHERATREKSLEETGEVLATWERIADRFRPAVPGIVLACLGAFSALHSPEVSARSAGDLDALDLTNNIHYANQRRRRRLPSLRRWFATVFPIIEPQSVLAAA